MPGAATRPWWLLGLLAAALFAGGCASVSAPPIPRAMSATERVAYNRRVFDRAWSLIDRKFFDGKFGGVDWPAMQARYRPAAEEAPDDETLYREINTMIGELNASHLVAISPRYAYEDRTHRRAAVGIRFRRVEEQWAVTDVLPASPAELAGVQRGWVITRRDGKPIGDELHSGVKEGQPVAYEFLDEAARPQARTMTARTLSVKPRTEARELEGGVLYLRFDEFAWASRGWLNQQLKEHRLARGVVIDLRQNPGGNAIALWAALGEFFPKRVPAGTFIRRSGGVWNTKSFSWFSAHYDGPLTVLVDGASASCSEIFAHVLQYHKRAVLIGRKTAGAVILSWFYGLPAGGRLQMAIQDYRGLDGQRIEGNGIVPDRVVPLKLADLRSGRDADLDLALQVLQQPIHADAAAASP